ncbi:Inositol phosphorylceramide glucuronosyltransferase 1 [Camellia lanceoleosa]|uniref:Inositol phosphorylceramide glucuronosyltransferase 1 n=1 Tax=Camellia lanceoleosa TaxID=1840588 RepID=A0ACC0HE94_9ERIC|nr:Inositol phosphorylceramide glucuronosyltransferase 1 [Camellia lanceoleosa]
MQIHSFCDHVRQLYYKFRSRGILAYSAVSSSIVNSDQQFPNGLQSKVPMFLGGLSVFVCFVAAFISLALALLIVPRQVMPWTGMLLMYEWTFMIFFLLFGSYLHLIYLQPDLGWMRKLQQILGRKHQRNLHAIYVLHPTFGLKAAIFAMQLFVDSVVRLDVCVISQLEDGHFYLEDLTGTVEINI